MSYIMSSRNKTFSIGLDLWLENLHLSSQSKHADFCLIIDAQKQFYGNKFIIHIESIYTIYSNFVVIFV